MMNSWMVEELGLSQNLDAHIWLRDGNLAKGGKGMEVLFEGKGELLGWHDPDEAREWVMPNKHRELTNKLMTAKEAVEKFIRDGDYMASSMHDIMSLSQAGYIDYGFLGTAQIDRYGNLNTTVIGDNDHPKTRLPGSGGAADVASFSQKLIIIAAKQSKQTFVKKLDFLTTAGYLEGEGSREKAGLPKGTGPYRLVTQLGIYGFNRTNKRVEVVSLHPGVPLEEVKENSSFEILVPEKYGVSPTPPPEYLKLLREVIDPTGIVLGK
jgi:acyl CoA:acetate/3-ketoacid CoA transferase beta subunit